MDSNTNVNMNVKESSFKPKFYVIYLVVFSIYYFFSPIVSQLIFLFIKKNLVLNQLNFLYELFEKFFIPNFSIFLVLIIYIFLIEERNISFLFGSKSNFVNSTIKGILFSVMFLFSLIFIFILKDYIISFKLNTTLIFTDLLKIFLVFLFIYIKYFFLESIYRGWLFNILNYRYPLIACIVFTSLVPTIISFIEFKRIGFYLIYTFLFNVFLTLMFVIYNDIFLVISFHAFYEFLKKYILSIENMSVKLEPVFHTVINNKEVYNIENNLYSIIALGVIIGIAFLLHKIKFKM